MPVSFYTLDMGRYTITTRKVDGHEISVYLLDPDTRLANDCIDLTAKALRFYEETFAPYPYTRYGIVQSRGLVDMALEAYSFATFGPRALPDLIPHELSHTWWGGKASCTYTSCMWNEAFAEFSDVLFRRASGPARRQQNEAAAAAANHARRAYDAMPVATAFDSMNRAHAAIGYDKGEEVLAVLEREIGSAAMVDAMKGMLSYHPGEPLDWKHFEQIVNKVTGKDYRWFFEQWLERTGLPDLQLSNVRTAERNGILFLVADIIQTAKPYRISLDAKIITANDTKIMPIKLAPERVNHIELPVDSAPRSITLDPDGIIPLYRPPGFPDNVDSTVFILGQQT